MWEGLVGRAYGEGFMWEGLMWEGLTWEDSHTLVLYVRRVESGHKTRAHVEARERGQDLEPRYIRSCE